MHLRHFFTLLLPALALAAPLASPFADADPTPTLESLETRQQTPHPIVSYAPGAFTVAASSSPFLTANSVQYTFQTDGNFVIRSTGGSYPGTVLWSSNTGGHACTQGDAASCQLTFQTDGKLRIFVGSTAVWTSPYNRVGPQYVGIQLNFWGAQINPSIIQYADIVDSAGDIIWTTGLITCPPPHLIGC